MDTTHSPGRTAPLPGERHQLTVVPLEQCTSAANDVIGGKALGLSMLIANGMPVPSGFVVTADAYREYVEAHQIQPLIDAELTELASPAAADAAAARITEIFSAHPLTEPLAAAIAEAYHRIGAGQVAVRSSAVAEDRVDASFAGQQDTYLGIDGVAQVLSAVRRCWASLYTGRAVAYRARLDVAPEDVAMAVVVQQIVPAHAAGVMMTLEPVTGDQSQIYIESAFGLGEAVVSGTVLADRFWVAKADLTIAREEIADQTTYSAIDVESQTVQTLDIDPADGSKASLQPETVRELAELGRRIEDAVGMAMDVEWAVTADRRVLLLQARPETVWSNRAPLPEPGRGNDVLHGSTSESSWWTTTNAGEAIPGVPTPLTWSVWGIAAEGALRQAFSTMGALSAAECTPPENPEDRLLSIFYGRPAFQIDLFVRWGDRMPGASGKAVAEQICGFVPPNVGGQTDPWRALLALPRMVKAVARPARRAYNTKARAEKMWRASVARAADLNENDAKHLLDEACELFIQSTTDHAIVVMAGVQPVYALYARVIERAGADPRSMMGGLGQHEESDVVGDMWECSRDRLTLETFLDRHGYHGPNEGEIASRSWREDPDTLLRLIARYREADESAEPRAADTVRAAQRRAAEQELLAKSSMAQRVQLRMALWIASRRLPLRGVAKVALIQSNDIIGAAARRIGHHLVARDVIDDEDDVFYLTRAELLGSGAEDLRPLITERRAVRSRYQQMDVPSVWQGAPEPVLLTSDPSATAISGIPASPGIVEGIVRVVTDPADAQIESGEILVARDTDQGWASLMFLSAGLISDVGGVMSHTAVVARELGIPCVVSTRDGTRTLCSGDQIRLDGSAGTIEILSRATKEGE